MTWTAPSDPENVAMDRVRIAIGDIDTAEQILQDEDIAALIAGNGALAEARVYYLAASRAAARYAREVATAVGPLREEAQKKWEHFMGLAAALYREYQGLPPDSGTYSPVGNWPTSARVGLRSYQSAFPTPFFTRTYPRGGRQDDE
jgi:hypothetical protein